MMMLYDIESALATTVRRSASQAKLYQIAFLQALRRRWEGTLLGRQNRLAELCKEENFLHEKKMDEDGKGQGNMDGKGDGKAHFWGGRIAWQNYAKRRTFSTKRKWTKMGKVKEIWTGRAMEKQQTVKL